MDHVFELLFLTDHRVLDVCMCLLWVCSSVGVGFVDLVLEGSWVVGLGSWSVLPEGVVHDVLMVEEVVVIALVGTADLVELPDVLISHLLHEGEVCPLAGLVLEIHVGEVGEVDVHFADGPQQLSTIESCFGLNGGKGTSWALCSLVYSTKSLVTSPFSKMRTRVRG